MSIKFNNDRTAIKKSLKRLSFPKEVVIETTAYCNLSCIMCPQSTMTRSRGNMSMTSFKKIADEVGKHKRTRMWLAIMGEPLIVAKDLVKMIKYAKSVGVKEINLNTNAELMTPEIGIELIKSGLDKILIGLDALHRYTYNKIRVGGDYWKVVENIEALLKNKENMGAKTPLVIVQYIVMPENEEEVDQFKNYWLNRGVVVKIRPRLGWGTGRPTTALTLPDSARTYPCPWLTRTVSIKWDGTFNQCDGDWNGDYSPGDIKKSTIKEIWEGELAKRREKHWNGDFSHPLCSKCKDWQVAKSKFYYPKEK